MKSGEQIKKIPIKSQTTKKKVKQYSTTKNNPNPPYIFILMHWNIKNETGKLTNILLKSSPRIVVTGKKNDKKYAHASS